MMTNTHTTTECRVVQAQINDMKKSEPGNNFHKCQKTGNNKEYKPKTPGGNLHTLLDSVEKVKAHIEKELKQHGQACGKRKPEEASKVEKQETVDNKEKHDVTVEDNFNAELEHLSLSDVNEDELEDLDDLSDLDE
jgi:hypothetical protein